MEPLHHVIAAAGQGWLVTVVWWIATPIVVAGLVGAALSLRRRRLSEGQRIVVATVGGANLLQAGGLLAAGLAWPIAVLGAIVGLLCVSTR